MNNTSRDKVWTLDICGRVYTEHVRVRCACYTYNVMRYKDGKSSPKQELSFIIEFGKVKVNTRNTIGTTK